MGLTSAKRAIVGIVMLIGLLFMQLAVAAYACPSMEVARADMASTMEAMSDDGAMPGCDGMPIDDAQPNLCHAHHHVGNQSLDKPALPDIQPFIVTRLVAIRDDYSLLHAPPLLSFHPILTRTSEPSKAIRHCCFRT